MTEISLALDEATLQALLRHVLRSRIEDAAFLFARFEPTKCQLLDWYPVPEDDFETRSEFYLELSDATRATVIKKAHDLSSSIVEVHSHPSHHEVEFSPSDIAGLREFVPHVRWRLGDRPYGAIVVSPSTIDSLVWTESSKRPDGVLVLETPERLIQPTRHTIQQWRA